MRDQYLQIMNGQQYPEQIRHLLSIGTTIPPSIVFDQEKWSSEVEIVCRGAYLHLFKKGHDLLTPPKELRNIMDKLDTADTNSEEERDLLNEKLGLLLSYVQQK